MASNTEAILTLDSVVAGYGKMTILNGVSAAIRRGAITTVIGPNGAGKSTLFKTVFGLLGVRTGRVTFDGADTTSFEPRRMLQKRHLNTGAVKSRHRRSAPVSPDIGAAIGLPNAALIVGGECPLSAYAEPTGRA